MNLKPLNGSLNIAAVVACVCIHASHASAQAIQPGTIIDRVPCVDNPAQTYALYLPSAYSPERTWSLLLAFHPAARGHLMAEKYQAAAEQYGYIIAASNNSRNGPYAVSTTTGDPSAANKGAKPALDAAINRQDSRRKSRRDRIRIM